MTSRFFTWLTWRMKKSFTEMKETGRNRLKCEEEEESDLFCKRHI